MELQRLKDLKLASPFKPFYLILRDGRRFFVERSSHFGVAPDGSRVGVASDQGVVLVTLSDVAGVDMMAGASVR